MRTGIIISLCVLFAVESCIALTTSPWMYIRSVRLSGLARLLPEEAAQVRALAVVPPRTNLLRADTRKLERELKSLSFVSMVRVAIRPIGRLEFTFLHLNPIPILSNC